MTGGAKITVGMVFGTYDSKVEEGRRKSYYNLTANCGLNCFNLPDDKYTFYKPHSAKTKENEIGSAWSTLMSVYLIGGGRKTVEYKEVTLFGFTYSGDEQNWQPQKKDYKFTRIETDTQYAVDFNRNGIVDAGEIRDK